MLLRIRGRKCDPKSGDLKITIALLSTLKASRKLTRVNRAVYSRSNREYNVYTIQVLRSTRYYYKLR